MNKRTTPSPWDDNEAINTATAKTPKDTKAAKTTAQTVAQAPVDSEPLYDIDGLMTDFPTARELEKFVYDQTGYVLNLKGRSNKFKYQTAMDVLNGAEPDPALLGNENPYLDKNDIIPVDPMKKIPPTPQEVRGVLQVTSYINKQFPHPDPEWAAMNQKCEVIFRKYMNITNTLRINVTSLATISTIRKISKWIKFFQCSNCQFFCI